MSEIVVSNHSSLRCPFCAATSEARMPTGACVIRLECACGVTLRPKSGDCCVFCSYGSVPSPPIQVARATGIDACHGGTDAPGASNAKAALGPLAEGRDPSPTSGASCAARIEDR